MTGRHTVNTITSDALDELYDRLDRIRDAAVLHRQRLIRTSELYAVIEADPQRSTEEAAMTDQTPKHITIDAPSEATILAARHLDATEGRAQVGSTIDTSTRSAITTVLRHIAEAHNMRAAIPARDEVSRYDRLSPLARALVDDYDELDLAEMLVKTQDEIVRLAHHHAAIHALDAPLRDQLQAAIKALGTTETTLTRVRAACDQMERAVINADGRLLSSYDRGVDTAIRRVRKALDQPAPAATEATEPPRQLGDHTGTIPTNHTAPYTRPDRPTPHHA